MADKIVDDVLDTGNEPGALDPTSELDDTGDEEGDMDWEAEAKKFQSIADKRQADLDAASEKLSDMKQLEQLGDYLQESPELVQVIQDYIVSGGQGDTSPKEDTISYDEFNPWDAYHKPESPSYKFRIEQERELVDEAVQQHMTKAQQNAALNNLVSELKNVHKLDDNEVGEFMDFVSQPKDKIDTASLIKFWQESTGKKVETQNTLDAVRKNKGTPQSAGAVTSAGGAKKSEVDKVWDVVKKADERGRIF